MKDRELKNREVKIKRQIEELFFKLVMVSIDDMDKFEQREMKKIRQNKNNNYIIKAIINHIPEPIRKSIGGFKDKIVSLFRTNTPKQTVMGEERN